MSDLTAMHEAAHATVGLLLGEFPERASIRAEGASLGHVQSLQVEAEAIARAAVLGRTPQDREVVMSNLIATAAGPVAQAMVAGGLARSFPFPWGLHGGVGDHEIVGRIMRKAGALLEANEDDVVQGAIDLLEHPEIWSAVKHVAKDLLQFGELDYAGIRDAVLNHDAIRRQTVADRLGI